MFTTPFQAASPAPAPPRQKPDSLASAPRKDRPRAPHRPPRSPLFARLAYRVLWHFLRAVAWLFYRLRVAGEGALPERGAALIISNHVSWIDGILILLASRRPVRMLARADFVEPWPMSWFCRLAGVIPLRPGTKSLADALRLARAALNNGELVCIFAEGGISRTGQLRGFKRGFLSLVRKTPIPIIPVYLDGLWGSIFSFSDGKFFWKWPRGWQRRVSIWIGQPLGRVDDVSRVHRAVAELGAQAVGDRTKEPMILPRAMLRACRRALRRSKVADTSGQDMTGGALLMRSLILRRVLLREVLSADEKHVGLLLPPSAGGVLANTAVTLAGRVTVNLNYTVSADVMNSCIKQAGLRHVLTSRRVLDKLGYDLQAEPVFLEQVRDKVTLVDKLAGAIAAYAMPLPLLERSLGLMRLAADDLLTIIFTSGSTGEPKGVMLTHRNVGSNIAAFDQLVRLNDDDVVAGVLPFFHSFGYTATLWTVLALPPKGVYHYDPRDARQVGEMCGKHRATILIATPTFLRFYLRRCQPEDFSALDVVLAGAEKVPQELCDAFEQKFGVRPVEGYGATELSPVVAVNIPPSRAADKSQTNTKEGTVGRPLPGVAARITDPESGQELGRNTPGMLWIAGPNVMAGYLGQPERTADVLHDGWYKTGDIALVDDDGFIRITGRESRFSKLGGEMVPHLKIEETIQKIIGAGEDELKVAVAAVPEQRKGERLVVLHTALEKTPDAICKELSQAGLPNLWIPSPDSFCQVEEIPVLGTGKIDLKGLQKLALETFGEQPTEQSERDASASR